MMPLLADHLWQSTIFAALAALLCALLRHDRAQVRYWVWLAASLKFLVPFAALASLGTHINWIPVAMSGPQRTLTVIQTLSQPYSQTEFDLGATSASAVARSVLSTTLPVVLLAAWLAGFVWCAVQWLLRWRQLDATIRCAVPLESGREVDSLRRAQRTQGVTRVIRLLGSNHVLEPGVIGIARPRLLWPVEIGRHLDDAHIDAIVAHEVCHIRRRDNLAALVHMLVEALFWFYPLVWWIGARLIDERERACDEAVIELGSAPYVYAQSILKTCQLCVESPLICAAGVTGSDLKRRIVHIMKGEARRNLSAARKLLLTASASAAIVTPLAIGMLCAPRVWAQIPSADPNGPRFDVASVKRSQSDNGRRISQARPEGFGAENFTVHELIRLAYQIQDSQIGGGPAWVTSDRFDIAATAAGNAGRDFGPMLRNLLAERFKLAAHVENRNLPIYRLVTARADGKAGAQLRVSQQDCTVMTASAREGGTLPPPLPPPPPQPGERPACSVVGGFGRFSAGGVTASQLAASLSIQVRRMVIDETHLAGRFDFDLSWTPEQLPPRAPGTPPDQPIRMNGLEIDPNGPSIFTALQEQLGLKLESTTGPVEVLVIDHVEQPTEN